MRRTLLAACAAAALAVAGGGAAIAATGLGSPREESRAVVEDAAEQLGVEAAELSDALKQALANRVDEAVAAGRLTEEQGAALKERIESQEYPLLGGPGHGPRGGHGFRGLDAAAEYLGVPEAELREQLGAGRTLADVADAEGKTVDGLVDALVAEKEERLAAAVADGRLTQAEADERLARAEERVTALVNGAMPARGPHGHGPPAGEEGDEGEAPQSGSSSSAGTSAAGSAV